jgi:hypothetical protein
VLRFFAELGPERTAAIETITVATGPRGYHYRRDHRFPGLGLEA